VKTVSWRYDLATFSVKLAGPLQQVPGILNTTLWNVFVCVCVCVQILQWLLCLTTKVLCEGRKFRTAVTSDSCHMEATRESPVKSPGRIGTRRTLPEYQLIASFLMRVKLREIRAALNWIHNT
jgi:hypothetical protein